MTRLDWIRVVVVLAAFITCAMVWPSRWSFLLALFFTVVELLDVMFRRETAMLRDEIAFLDNLKEKR